MIEECYCGVCCEMRRDGIEPKRSGRGYDLAEAEPVKISPRAALLREAESLTCGDRNNTYGPPTQDFERTAAMWNAMWGHKLREGERFDPHDVASGVIAIKLSRLVWSPGKRDNWTDIAGYAACGWESVGE